MNIYYSLVILLTNFSYMYNDSGVKFLIENKTLNNQIVRVKI